ncbi:MAG: lysophospholipid acyltransferase family protein [Desulfobacteraceae bacterium]|nr:lysophospholipid acyltransferase family protein [Desulfobacteraceae bacterium]
MRLSQYPRAVTVLIATPILTGITSLAAILLIVGCRLSAIKAQILPQLWARAICRLAGARVKVLGREGLDPSQSYIFAANHQSQFDIFALQGYLGIDFRWLAKKELFAVPVFGRGMRLAGYIPVDRSRGRQALQSLNEAAERIAGGTSVIIFPEGTRSPDGQIHPFKSGAMMLAIKAGVPIVPVAIIGTHEVLAKGRLLAQSGPVTIRLGRPLDISRFKAGDRQELAGLIQAEVTALFDQGQA